MRARNIKPGLFKNDELAECEIAARYLFTGLWCMADREGRLEDRPKRIKVEILPYDDVDIDDLMGQLERHHFIQRYAVDGERYIQISNFTKHQRPHSSEVESEIPPPSDGSVPNGSPDDSDPSTKVHRAVNQGEPSGAPNTQAPRPDTGSLNADTGSSDSLGADASANGAEEPRKPRRKRKPDPHWDAMAALMGYSPETESERGAWNKAIKQIRDSGAQPSEISRRAQNYRLHYPEARLTPPALARHWGVSRDPPKQPAGQQYQEYTPHVRDDPEEPP